IGTAAVKLKFSGIKPVPFSAQMSQKEGLGFHHKGQKFIHHSNLLFDETAFYRLNNGQTLIGVLLIFLLVAAFILNWQATIIAILGFLSFLYLVDLFYNFYL